MYQFSYAEVQTDSVADARDREKQLLSRSIDLLQVAKDKGAKSMHGVEALLDGVPYRKERLRAA